MAVVFETVIGQYGNLLTALLLLVTGVLVGWLVRRGVDGGARRAGLDRLVARTDLAEGLRLGGVERSPSALLGRLAFWLILLLFLIAALDVVGLGEVVRLLDRLLLFVPRLLAAIVIVVVGAWLAQWLGRTTQTASAGMGIDFDRALGSAVRMLILVMTLIIAIDQLGFDISLLTATFINLLTLFVAALALAFGLGARDVARNVLAGYYARDFLQPGARIVVERRVGELDAIGPLNSELRTEEGRVIIPNSWLTDREVLVLDDSVSATTLNPTDDPGVSP